MSKAMLKHFDTPSYFEGWNEIKMCYPKRAYRSFYGTPSAFVERYIDYSQDNPHHDYSLGNHCKSTGYVKSGSFAETWAKKAQVNYITDFTLDNNGGVLNGAQTTLLTYIGNKKKYEVPSSVNIVDDMAFAFHSELKSVIIPKSVTSIGTYTFAMCQSLTDIVLSEGITSIGEGAFYNCTSLKHVTIPSSVTSIGNGAFTGDNGNLSITVYGTAGSYAETWAKNNGYTFIAQ